MLRPGHLILLIGTGSRVNRLGRTGEHGWDTSGTGMNGAERYRQLVLRGSQERLSAIVRARLFYVEGCQARFIFDIVLRISEVFGAW